MQHWPYVNKHADTNLDFVNCTKFRENTVPRVSTVDSSSQSDPSQAKAFLSRQRSFSSTDCGSFALEQLSARSLLQDMETHQKASTFHNNATSEWKNTELSTPTLKNNVRNLEEPRPEETKLKEVQIQTESKTQSLVSSSSSESATRRELTKLHPLAYFNYCTSSSESADESFDNISIEMTR